MTIERFNTYTDGLKPEQRMRGDFTQNFNPQDEKRWVPYGEGAHFWPVSFGVSRGGFSNILRIQPGSKLNPHYHTDIVYGFTLQGTWHYLEHDWVAVKGTSIYEPAGEAHTLVVPADATEPMMTFFVAAGGLVYLDSPKNGRLVGYDDGFTLLELARRHYREMGLDVAEIDRLCR